MKWTISALFTLLLLTAACGSRQGEDSTSANPSSTQTTQSSVSLHDSCPQVEAVLPNGAVPSASKWKKTASRLSAIADAGDTETKTALEALRDAVGTLADDPANGEPHLEADQKLLNALDDLAKRCKVVGSSALQ